MVGVQGAVEIAHQMKEARERARAAQSCDIKPESIENLQAPPQRTKQPWFFVSVPLSTTPRKLRDRPSAVCRDRKRILSENQPPGRDAYHPKISSTRCSGKYTSCI